MKIMSHAELEKYHYQALSNQHYQLEGMTDVIHEELLMSKPHFIEKVVQEDFFSLRDRIAELESQRERMPVVGEVNYLLSKVKFLKAELLKVRYYNKDEEYTIK